MKSGRAPESKESQFRNQDNLRSKRETMKTNLQRQSRCGSYDAFKEPEFKGYGPLRLSCNESNVINVLNIKEEGIITPEINYNKGGCQNTHPTGQSHQHDDNDFDMNYLSETHDHKNIACNLPDFQEFDGGYVAFGGGVYGGRITGKGTFKTDNLDFKDVYFVNELKFNLFSISQMCDKKNYVLFTNTECLVLSPNFKLPDENQILLKIPRKDNMYSFDMKNIVPKDSYLRDILGKDMHYRDILGKDMHYPFTLMMKHHSMKTKHRQWLLHPINQTTTTTLFLTITTISNIKLPIRKKEEYNTMGNTDGSSYLDYTPTTAHLWNGNSELEILRKNCQLKRARVFEQNPSTSNHLTMPQQCLLSFHQQAAHYKVKSGHTGAYSTYTPSTSSNNIPEREVPTGARKKSKSELFLTKMTDVVNWGEHTVEEVETNHALMAISSNNEPNSNFVRPNVNTGRANVNSDRANVNSVRQNVNSVRTHPSRTWRTEVIDYWMLSAHAVTRISFDSTFRRSNGESVHLWSVATPAHIQTDSLAAETLAKFLTQITKTYTREVNTGLRRKLDADEVRTEGQREERQVLEEKSQSKRTKKQIREEQASLTEIDSVRAKLEANRDLSNKVLSIDFSSDDFAKKMVELINEKKRLYKEQKERDRRNRPMTQAEQRKYMIKKVYSCELKLEASKTSERETAPVQNHSSKVFTKKQKITDVPDVIKDESVKREEKFKVQQPIMRYNVRKSLARKGLQKNKSEFARSDTKEDVEAYMDERVDEPSSEEFQMGSIPQGSAPAKIVKWQILKTGKKGAYQIIREDHTDIVYVNFHCLLNDLTRDDLKELYRLMMLKYGDSRPEEEYEREIEKMRYIRIKHQDLYAIGKDTSYIDPPTNGCFKMVNQTIMLMNPQTIVERCPDVTTGSLKLNAAGPSVNTVSTNEQESTKEEPKKTHDTLNTCLYACFLSQIEPTSIAKALSDSSWVEAMQEELLQFKLQQGWIPVDLPSGKGAIGTKWVFRNKKDKRGIVIRNKARLLWFASRTKSMVYVDDIIFGSTNKELCTGFEKLMKDKFQMSSMGELNYSFLGLPDNKEYGIFINQDKYGDEILKKFNYLISMIGSLMYLTASRPDIMFVVCASARFQVTPKTSHLLAVQKITTATQKLLPMGAKVTNCGAQFLSLEQLFVWELLFVNMHQAGTGKDMLYQMLADEAPIRSWVTEYKGLPLLASSLCDKAVHKELGDRIERAATTAFSLEAEQDNGSGPRCQDTILGDADAQTRFEIASNSPIIHLS
ncbi:hypothetical protein Tco_0091289 [Tanacetum coccineum]